MNSSDYQIQLLQQRVRDLETRMLQLEDRVVFDPPTLSAGPITPEMANWSAADKAELGAVITKHMKPAPVQEPVAWLDPRGDEYCNVITASWKREMQAQPTRLEQEYAAKHTVPVYTTPPAAHRPWTGLTDDAKLDLISDAKGIGGRVRSDAQLLVLLDMQEAKLKENNT